MALEGKTAGVILAGGGILPTIVGGGNLLEIARASAESEGGGNLLESAGDTWQNLLIFLGGVDLIMTGIVCFAISQRKPYLDADSNNHRSYPDA